MGNTFFRVEYILYKYIATFNESICGVNRIGDQTWGYLLRGSGSADGVCDMLIRRGDIYYADLRPVVGSEQGGIRPVIVVQNEAGNRHSSTVIIAAITSKMKRPKLPTHIMLDSSSCDIAKDSVILLEQLRTIDKQRLKEKVCHVDADVLRRVDEALKISLELA